MDLSQFNPMTMGFLATALGQNPDLAQVLDGMGLPAPDASQIMMPGVAVQGLGANLTGMPGGGGGAPQVAGTLQQQMAGATVPGVPGPLKPMTAPTVDKPIMSGGVAGSQKAPDPKVPKGPPQAIQALMAMMGGGPNLAPPVPGTLGSFLRQGGSRY